MMHDIEFDLLSRAAFILLHLFTVSILLLSLSLLDFTISCTLNSQLHILLLLKTIFKLFGLEEAYLLDFTG